MANEFKARTAPFTLQYPDEWEYHIGAKGAVSLFDPDPTHLAGVLTVSILFPPTGVFPDGARWLSRLAAGPARLPSTADARRLAAAQPGALVDYIEFERDGSAWRAWALSAPEWLVLATYNCLPARRGVQDITVDEIVASIRVEELRRGRS